MASNAHLSSDKLFQINNEPLRFFLGLSSRKNSVKQLIEKHGGLVLSKLPDSFQSQEILLNQNGHPCNPTQLIILLDTNAKVTRTNKFTARQTDCFSMSYVESCVEQNKLLDLNSFRIGSKTFSTTSIENSSQTKKRFHVSEEEKVSSFPKRKTRTNVQPGITTTPDSVKRSRQKYTHEHDLVLVNFVQEMIKKYPEEKPLGNKLWRRAERLQILGPHRSWQSMRDRFKTHLQPYLDQKTWPNLSWNQLSIDKEDPVSPVSDKEDNMAYSSAYNNDSDQITQEAVSATRHLDESPREIRETQVLSEEQPEQSSVILDSDGFSMEASHGQEENFPLRFLGENDAGSHNNAYRKLQYDEEESKANNLEKEHLVRQVIQELSNKYCVPEKDVCLALLDASGSVDKAILSLRNQKS